MTNEGHEHEARLQRYLDGSMSPGEAAAFEMKVLASDDLSGDMADELSLRRLLDARSERRLQARRRRRQRLLWGAVPATAAVAAAMVLMLRVGPQEATPPVYRGERENPAVAIAPLGGVAEIPREFRWHAMPGAESYRLEIFDSQARRIHAVTVFDTVYAAPADWAAPGSGHWQVSSMDDLGIAQERAGPFPFHRIGD